MHLQAHKMVNFTLSIPSILCTVFSSSSFFFFGNRRWLSTPQKNGVVGPLTHEGHNIGTIIIGADTSGGQHGIIIRLPLGGNTHP